MLKWNEDLVAGKRAALNALEDANLSNEVLRRSEVRSRNEAVQQLHDHTEALKRFNDATISREARVIELKKEVNELCKRLNEDARYSLELEKDVG